MVTKKPFATDEDIITIYCNTKKGYFLLYSILTCLIYSEVILHGRARKRRPKCQLHHVHVTCVSVSTVHTSLHGEELPHAATDLTVILYIDFIFINACIF